MTSTAATLKNRSASIALVALLAVVYGSVLRRFGGSAGSRTALGVIFGGAAILAMQAPFVVAEGVFVDLRHLPVTLAGAFLAGAARWPPWPWLSPCASTWVGRARWWARSAWASQASRAFSGTVGR